MKKSVEILGLPIISITEGRELGVSKTLLIDAKNGQVAAITIEDDDWYRGVKLIPYESVIAIGEDAVTITHSENILNLDEAGDYERLLVENIRVIGTKAITKTGRIQGKITEVFIGDGGKIEKCEITAPNGEINEVNAEQVSIFGKQVTVVDIDGEKKTDLVTETPPAFQPANEPVQEEPSQDVWTPAAESLTETVEPPVEPEAVPDISDTPIETVEAAEVLDMPVETVEAADILDAPVETVAAADVLDMPVETVEAADVLNIPVETVEATEVLDIPVETVETAEVSEPPAQIEESPKPVEEPPAVEPQPSEEDKKLETMTQQAEALKAALKKARDNSKSAAAKSEPRTPQKAQVEKAVDERRRRVLLGKHATKTITAESGTVVVEAGAEVTEEVLQRARLSNKFIELSMNVQ